MSDEMTTASAPSPDGPESHVGPYRLQQLIGEGGFGAVYVAEQDQPVRRRVALKILKPGLESRDVIARFEQERQALALMDHPNIAKIFDGGATAAGRPYFVMELVRGEPITQFADRQNLSIAERLKLFLQICSAVQHAHQKGLIHRDLKPSNVLVGTTDDGPLAKVIDFGIAKATSAPLTDKTVFTRLMQVVGTPEYMSPEQAEGSLDIDTRTDIYSLGVLLYELLTGTTPIDPRQLREAAVGEMQRLIRDVDPPRPSTRVSTAGATLATTAAHRRTEARRLPELIRGDLDWIVMKALEKDRQRRYETANGLAMDVQRHLSGESVLAAPPSLTYRTRKFVGRHTAAVVAAAVVVLALVAGITGTSIGLMRADQARRDADAARRQAEAMNTFLLDTLNAADPNQGGRQDRKVVDAMESAVATLDRGAFADQPEVEVRLRYTISNILNGGERAAPALVNAQKGLAIAKRLHAGDHPLVAEGLHFVARAQNGQAQFAAAEPPARQALEMSRRLDPAGHLDTARDLMQLAGILSNARRYADAAPLFHEAAEMRRTLISGDDRDVAQSTNDEGYALMYLGRFVEAGQRFEASRAMRARLFNGDDPDIAESLNNLAWSLERQHKVAEAEVNYRGSLEMYRRLFSGDHRFISRELYTLGWNVMEQGRWEEAQGLLTEALDMATRLAPGSTGTQIERTSLIGTCELMRGHAAEADRWYARSLEIYLGAGNPPGVSLPMRYVGGMVSDMTTLNPSRAVTLAAAVYARARRTLPKDSPALFDDAVVYASALLASGAVAEATKAEGLLRAGLASLPPPSTPDARVGFAQSLMGWAILRQIEAAASSFGTDRASTIARLREAEPLIVTSLETLVSRRETIHPYYRFDRLAGAAGRAGRLYDLWNRVEPDAALSAKAAQYLKDAEQYSQQTAGAVK